MSGNPIILEGAILEDGRLLVGMTAVNGVKIVTFHYTGKVSSRSSADGKFTCFADHKKVFSGTWELTGIDDDRD